MRNRFKSRVTSIQQGYRKKEIRFWRQTSLPNYFFSGAFSEQTQEMTTTWWWWIWRKWESQISPPKKDLTLRSWGTQIWNAFFSSNIRWKIRTAHRTEGWWHEQQYHDYYLQYSSDRCSQWDTWKGTSCTDKSLCAHEDNYMNRFLSQNFQNFPWNL